MRQPETFLDPQNAPKSLAASPQIPLGELTTLPRPPSWIQGVLLLRLLLLRGGEGKGGEGRRGEGTGREGRGGKVGMGGQGRGGQEREGLPRLEITSGYALDSNCPDLNSLEISCLGRDA